MAVITISRQFGAGGRTLGQMIAKEFDYQFLDDVIISEISKKAKVSVDSVKAMERTAGGKLSKLFSGLISRDYIKRIIGDDKGYIDEKIYLDVLEEVMKSLANQDNVVLMGRGGQYILKDFPNAYHLLLIADFEKRIDFILKHYNMTKSSAEQAVMMGEKRRNDLYFKIGKEDYNQADIYHMVLNMSKLSLEKALKMVCTLMS